LQIVALQIAYRQIARWMLTVIVEFGAAFQLAACS
jgi:hypothetical protein